LDQITLINAGGSRSVFYRLIDAGSLLNTGRRHRGFEVRVLINAGAVYYKFNGVYAWIPVLPHINFIVASSILLRSACRA